MTGYSIKAELIVKITVILFLLVGSLVSKTYASHVVWPKNNEGGTFYLSLTRDKKSNLFPRKGYISAGTPITLKTVQGKSVPFKLAEKKYGARFVYYEFVAATGVRGLIKANSIKETTLLAEKGNKSLIDQHYKYLVAPIHPSIPVVIDLNKNFSGSKHTYSRSALSFVVTNGKVDYLNIDDGEVPFINVKFFQHLESGNYQVREGWLRYSGNHELFKLYELVNYEDKYITLETSKSTLTKIKDIFSYWFNHYDDNKLGKAFSKACDQEIELKAELKADTESPFPYFSIGGEVSGQVTYVIPKNYRFIAHSYIERSSMREIRVLKTIKCKPNTTRDWFAEHIVFGGVLDTNIDLDLFQDETSSRLSEYFEKPIVAGARVEHDKMIRIKKLKSDTKFDFFSAFYRLERYLEEEVLDQIPFSENEKILLKAFLAEQLVEYR